MNRRGFLGAIGAAITGAALDPERLLWVPGQRVISVPSVVRPAGNVFITPEALARMILDNYRIQPKIGRTLNVRRPPKFLGRS